MLLPIVLWISVLIQVAAAYFALRLISVTERWLGWILFATAISLMVARRLIVFFHWFLNDHVLQPDLTAELISLAISLLMLIGLAWIAPMLLEMRRSKKHLEEREQFFRDMFDATFEGIVVHDQGEILNVNAAFARMFGYRQDEILGRNVLELVEPEYRPVVAEKIRAQSETSYEIVGRTKDGRKLYQEVVGKPFQYRGRSVRLTVVRDVTFRKEAEQALAESEARLRSIFENAIIGLYQTTPEGKVIMANPALVRMLGFTSFKEMARRNLRELGYDAGYPRSEFILRIERDGEVIGLESKWKRRDGTILYVRESARVVRDENGNTLHYEGTIEDITDRKIAEKALHESVETLRKAMEGTIQAMGMILESRDPYTAGHQRMVAELSCAIGKEMGLEEDRIDGLRMAAAVHDLGKISVPAEILSKPGKLSEIESNMVRHHERIGQDILGTINFPWPVARIVSQYHEHWDGTGYPKGLKENQILIEARILAVADVVEAMASHRPYRPALGIDQALMEIEKGRGTLYDPDVVDACLRLFREKGYPMNFHGNGMTNGKRRISG